MARGRHHNKKRQQWQIQERHQEDEVDDLTHAAQFAMAMPPSVATISTTSTLGVSVEGDKDDQQKQNAEEGDDIEIEDIDDDDDDDSFAPSIGNDDGGEEAVAEPESDDDNDDNESDVDLAAVVAEMEKHENHDDIDETGGVGSSGAPPKTEHELDAYQTPIQELERHLHIQLTVEEAGNNDKNDARGTLKFKNLNSGQLSLAGHVKHIMGGTLIIESATTDNKNNSYSDGGFEDVVPLDEGSLLLIRGLPPSVDVSDDGNRPPNLIPLGRVFEVFGPVSRPLYTIRLPSTQQQSQQISSGKASKKKKNHKKTPIDEKKVSMPTPVSGTTDVTSSFDVGGTGEKQSHLKQEDANTDHIPNISNTAEDDEEVVSSMDTSNTDDKKSNALMKEEAKSEKATMETDDDPVQPSKESSNNSPGDEHASKGNGTKADPWSANGEYAKLLLPGVSVYYVKDEAKLVDTGAIMRISGKGCGRCRYLSF